MNNLPDPKTKASPAAKKLPRTYRKAPIWILEHRQISPGAKVVYIVLYDRQGRNKNCWPSQKQLASDTAYTVRSVQILLQELVEHNLIRVIRTGKQQPNRYEILPQPETEKVTDLASSDAKSFSYHSGAESIPTASTVIPPPVTAAKSDAKDSAGHSAESDAKDSAGPYQGKKGIKKKDDEERAVVEFLKSTVRNEDYPAAGSELWPAQLAKVRGLPLLFVKRCWRKATEIDGNRVAFFAARAAEFDPDAWKLEAEKARKAKLEHQAKVERELRPIVLARRFVLAPGNEAIAEAFKASRSPYWTEPNYYGGWCTQANISHLARWLDAQEKYPDWRTEAETLPAVHETTLDMLLGKATHCLEHVSA